jgi:hypothetical protein
MNESMGSGRGSACADAVHEALGVLKHDGSTRAARERMLTMEEYTAVLRLADVEAWERRFMS